MIAATVALLFWSGSSAGALDAVFSSDVPLHTSPASGEPRDLLQTPFPTGGTYNWFLQGAAKGLGPGIDINAVALESSDRFLLSTDAPFLVAMNRFEARDVVRFDSGVFSLVLDGSAEAIPAGTVIDALSTLPNGDLILSFDSPTRIGGWVYQPSDLVAWTPGGGFSLFWSTGGIPPQVNIDAVAVISASEFYFSFDSPASFGGVQFEPWELGRIKSSTVTKVFSDSVNWPAGSSIDAFSLAPLVGYVPDGSASRPGSPLTLSKSGSDIVLTYGLSCRASAVVAYAVYEGALTAPFSYGHDWISCGGGLSGTVTVTPNSGSRYYIVVPGNSFVEGSYGRDSSGSERPQSAVTCLPVPSDPRCSR